MKTARQRMKIYCRAVCLNAVLEMERWLFKNRCISYNRSYNQFASSASGFTLVR